MLHYDQTSKAWVWTGNPAIAASAKFIPGAGGYHFTTSPYLALALLPFATQEAADALAFWSWSIELSRAGTDVTPEGFNLIHPEGVTPKPYQVTGVYYALTRRQPSALFGDYMGIGKTAQMILTANYIGAARRLFVVKSSLAGQWAEELEKWSTLPNKPVIVKGVKKAPDFLRTMNQGQVICSYNTIAAHPELFHHFDFMGIDEAHALKNPCADRSINVLGRKGPARTAGFLAFATATPMMKLNSDIHSLIEAGAHHAVDFQRYYDFDHYYNDQVLEDVWTSRRDPRTGKPMKVTTWKRLGPMNDHELRARLRSEFMVRRLWSDIPDHDKPATSRCIVEVTAEGDFKKLVQAEGKYINEKEVLETGGSSAPVAADLRKKMGLAMVPVTVNFVRHLFLNDIEKVVVFCIHIDVVLTLKAELAQYNPAILYGGCTPTEKEQARNAFNNDPSCRVFIGNDAASEGLNLQIAHELVVCEPDWTGWKNEQIACRIDRTGQTHQTNVYYLVVKGSVTARVLKEAAKSLNQTERSLDYREMR